MAKKELSSFSEEVLRIMPQVLRATFRKSKDVLTQGKISLPQFLLLDILDLKGAIKMNVIAKSLRITLPGATGLVNRSVKMGMVRRLTDERDRRIVLIVLTSRGKATISQVRLSRRRAIEDVFSVLTVKERITYVDILRKLRDKLYPIEKINSK